MKCEYCGETNLPEGLVDREVLGELRTACLDVEMCKTARVSAKWKTWKPPIKTGRID